MKKVYIHPCTRISNMMPSNIIAGSGNAEAELGTGGDHETGNGIGGVDVDDEGAGVKRFYQVDNAWD